MQCCTQIPKAPLRNCDRDDLKQVLTSINDIRKDVDTLKQKFDRFSLNQTETIPKPTSVPNKVPLSPEIVVVESPLEMDTSVVSLELELELNDMAPHSHVHLNCE